MKWQDYIKLPELSRQDWTLEGQVLKILEEPGEVSQASVKNMNPEKAAAEILDVIMTGATMLYMLETRGVDVDKQFEAFLEKLKDRGYWREE